MRRFVLMVSILLVATAAIAADADSPKMQLSVFTSDLSGGHSNGETTWAGGVGMALAYSFTPRWSAELKAAREQHWNEFTATPPPGSPYVPVPERVKVYSYPIDLLGEYRFPNRSRWTPYVNGGLHYVSSPKIDQVELCAAAPPCTAWISLYDPAVTNRYGMRLDAQVGAGTAFRITPHFGMRFDVNVLLFTGSEFYDRAVRPSFGVNWKF